VPETDRCGSGRCRDVVGRLLVFRCSLAVERIAGSEPNDVENLDVLDIDPLLSDTSVTIVKGSSIVEPFSMSSILLCKSTLTA